jgi:hypothetical protein
MTVLRQDQRQRSQAIAGHGIIAGVTGDALARKIERASWTASQQCKPVARS